MRRSGPLCRCKPESPLEALGIAGPYLGVDDARRPLAVKRVENLLGGYPARGRPAPVSPALPWSPPPYAGSQAHYRTAAADDPAVAVLWTRHPGQPRRSI